MPKNAPAVPSESEHPFDTIDVGGIPFAATRLQGAADWLISHAANRHTKNRGTSVRLANAYCVALANRDARYGGLLKTSGVNFPDGAPVQWTMRLASRGTPLATGRVRGPSFFEEVLSRGRERHIRHFFLGTTDQTLGLLESHARAKYPGLEIAGSYAPPFGPVDSAWADSAISAISAHAPDLIWVALGTPKQDFAAQLLAQGTGLPCAAVGAAFDFLAGSKREAPTLLQRLGVEWVYRLVTEPRRLWRRYLLGNLRFLVAVARGYRSGRVALRVRGPQQPKHAQTRPGRPSDH